MQRASPAAMPSGQKGEPLKSHEIGLKIKLHVQGRMGQIFINEKRSDVVSSSLLELSVFFFKDESMHGRVHVCVSV